MLSLIEVQCPHCGARGQIMVPPVGAIIIGPCPQCNELVVVFCGHVLPLDKDTMESGTLDDRREHLLGVLTEFLQDRLSTLLTDGQTEGEGIVSDNFQLPEEGSVEDLSGPVESTPERSPISQSELERFADVDLKLLDNRAYFKSVFDES